MERLRTIKTRVEIDTNKDTYVENFELAEEESVSEFNKRVESWIANIMELMG